LGGGLRVAKGRIFQAETVLLSQKKVTKEGSEKKWKSLTGWATGISFEEDGDLYSMRGVRGTAKNRALKRATVKGPDGVKIKR